MAGAQFARVHRTAHINADFKSDALGPEQVHPPVHHILFKLHVRDAIHEKPANPVCPLIHSNRMASLIELVRGCKAGGATADNRDTSSCTNSRWCNRYPALFKSPVNNCVLDVLDRDRRFMDAENTGAFTRRRTGSACELRKIVGLVQTLQRIFPAPLIDHVVPFRDQIINRTARRRLAERDTAIHAAGPLLTQVIHVRGSV